MAEEAILDTPDDQADDLDDGTMTADIDVPTNVDDDEDEEEPKEEPKDKEEEAPEGKDDDELRARFDKLEGNYERASTHIEDLNKAISGLRKENKELRKSGKNDPDDNLSDAQLIQIMEENKDDTGVMLHAMKQLIKQSNADVQALTDKKVDISRKQTEVEQFMKGWQGYVENNRADIDKAIDYMDLDSHPFKESLALGTIMVKAWPDIVKKIKEEAKQEALSGISDKNRKDQIKNNKPDTGGDKTNTGDGDTPSNWSEAADRLGLNKKQREKYFALMKKSSKKKES